MAAAAFTGGGAAVAGTAAYALCIAMPSGQRSSQIMRRHLIGEAAKVVVSLSLLIAALRSASDALPCTAGFVVAVMAYPLALLLVNGNTERH